MSNTPTGQNIERIEAWFQRIHQNKWFESCVVTVIIISAVTIGAKTFETSENYVFLQVLDYFVTLFFVVEAIIKILSHERKLDYFKHGWNIFDFTIVAISLIPFGSSQYVLLGRLLRIFRVLRIITVLPELKQLVESLLRAVPSILSITGLMFIIFYIYAVIGSYLFFEINPTLWGNVFRSLLTLFRVMTLEDWTDVMYETMDVYPNSWIFYVTFIFFTVLTFLNMFIGAIVSSIDNQKYDERQFDDDIANKEIHKKLDAIEAQLEQIQRQNQV